MMEPKSHGLDQSVHLCVVINLLQNDHLEFSTINLILHDHGMKLDWGKL